MEKWDISYAISSNITKEKGLQCSLRFVSQVVEKWQQDKDNEIQATKVGPKLVRWGTMKETCQSLWRIIYFSK